jgi:lipoprotein-anchoring transpeptidase ErfK/SrfK
MKTLLAGLVAPLFVIAAPCGAFTLDNLNSATFENGALPEGQSPLAAKVQTLLDRAGISPAVIDGYDGGMTSTALRAFERREGFAVDGVLDPQTWAALNAADQPPVAVRHDLTESDLGRITPDLPTDYAKLAERDWLGFETRAEAVAELFHMDVDFLRMLNPDAAFRPGEAVLVMQPGASTEGKAARIVVDTANRRLTALDADGATLADYPVGVGSDQMPSPSGTMPILAVAIEPTYAYRPDENFQQGDNTRKLTLPPGPNGPVGLVWIDLDKPTYGIHGTADPARLFSEYSHGCVRMTNWDALELAHMVDAGIEVEFIR